MKTVLAHGVWDILHPGHIEHLQAARDYGDMLIVSVTADEFVNKGPGRPVFPAADRARMLNALRIVDGTFVCDAIDATPAIERYHPDYYVKGLDYRKEDIAGNLEREKAAVELRGGELVFTDTPLQSSSKYAKQAFPILPEPAVKWVDDNREVLNTTWDWLERVSRIDVLVAGEAIVDVYHYVNPANKSPKDPVITWVPENGEDRFSGGGWVIGGHLLGIVGNVALNLSEPAVLKERWVHRPFVQKAFSLATVPDFMKVCEPLSARRKQFVLCADFGHGYFNPVPQVKGFLALTVQANSLNWGLNVLTRWPWADYVAIDRGELSLAVRDPHMPLHDAMVRVRNEMTGSGRKAPVVAITEGHAGAHMLSGRSVTQAPVFAEHSVDRLGAGDAFFAFTSPLAYLGAPPEVMLLVGSCASALHIQKTGNSPVKRAELHGFLKAVLA